MKFSIIVPVHNAEKTIEKCVKSLITQNASDLEIILIENASSDNSYEICKGLAEKNEQIKLVVCNSAGVSSARNEGLNQATGDIIGFCDSDDYYVENILADIEKTFIISHSDVIVTGYRTISSSESFRNRVFESDFYLSRIDFMKKTLNDVHVFGSVCNKFYMADCVAGIRFDEEIELCEDTYFNICCAMAKPQCTFFYHAVVTYNYVDNENGATNRQLEDLFDENNKLKYIVACERIIENYQLIKTIEENVRYAIFTHAILFLHMHDKRLDQEKVEGLRKEVCSNFGCFIKIMWQYNIRFNLKKLWWMFEEIPGIIRQ